MAPLLSYAEAAEQIRSYALALGSALGNSLELAAAETVPLAEALGRVLAQPILADRDQPPFPRSTRDGFACRAADANTHQPMRLTGQLRAGSSASQPLQPGEVWEIMTGAPVPEGADAVFMVEHAEVSGTGIRMQTPRTVSAGENIVPRGAEARHGDSLVAPGTRIAPAQIAMAAQCGYSQLTVTRRPRVAILSTGDELVPIESIPGPGQIRNSNSPMLAALVASAAGEALIFPTVADEESAVDHAFQEILATAPDMLLVTGGISAGRFDLVEDALTRAGAHFFFHGVAIQPGKPVAFGHVLPGSGTQLLREAQSPGRPVLALPGNPVSSAVTFQLFAAPLLAALAGDTSPHPRFAIAQLNGGWHGKPGLTRFLPAWCDFDLSPRVRLIPWQGSGDIAAFARSNCFAVIPPDAAELPEGISISILLP
jgi:molybdopterin molybdotransferase